MFKDVGGCVEMVDGSSGYGSMNSHTYLQQNVLELLMNDNHRNDTDMTYTLHNGDVVIVINLLNIHNLPQDKKSSNFNEMNVIFDTDDLDGYFLI